MAARLAAGGAVVRGGTAPVCLLRHRARGRGGLGAEHHLEVVARQPRLDPEGARAAEAQVDVVPEHRRVPLQRGARARDAAAVGVTLDDLEAGGERRLVERVRELAQPAADIRDEAAFAQLAAGDEAAPARRAPDLLPEAEGLAGRHHDAVEAGERDAEVLDLAGGERVFLGAGGAVPERRAHPGDDRRVAKRVARRVPPRRLARQRLIQARRPRNTAAFASNTTVSSRDGTCR